MQATAPDLQLNDAAAPRETSTKFKDKKIKELTEKKRRLVEVPYTATLADTINVLAANRVVAVPVAAPPGHWIGAGGSMIMEADKQTGVVRKHYIGMVTMLDIVAHVGDDNQGRIKDGGGGDIMITMVDFDDKLSVPVSSIIGNCLEGLNLWTLNPNTSIIDCMEVFSKGIHRALVPVDSQMENISGVQLAESASCYKMITQMDIIRFLKHHAAAAAAEDIQDVLSISIRDSRALTDGSVYAVSARAKAIDAIKCMKTASLHALPIVDAPDLPPSDEAHSQLINGHGRKLVGTMSATDLRACPTGEMKSWLSLGVMEFTNRVYENASSYIPNQGLVHSPRLLTTCYAESTLAEVMEKVVDQHVHRVWVVDKRGRLIGLVSLTDIIRACTSFCTALVL